MEAQTFSFCRTDDGWISCLCGVEGFPDFCSQHHHPFYNGGFSHCHILLFKTPWIFPIVIVLGGLITNISSKRIPQTEIITRKIKWANIWLFAFIFILAGISSEMARKNNWPHRRPINLFENTYRFGSLVFGGGQVLIPLMYEQFVARPESQKLIQRNPEYRKDQ